MLWKIPILSLRLRRLATKIEGRENLYIRIFRERMERKMEENETFFANRRKSKNKSNGIFVMNVTFITSTVDRKKRNVVENSNSLVKIAMICNKD